MWRLVVAAVGFGLSALTLAAQNSGMRPVGKYITAAEVADLLEKSVSEQGVVAGQSMQLHDSNGERITVRIRKAGPNNASVHDDLTEIYQIVDGGGTFVTGGTLPDPKNRTAGLKGGTSRKVTRGDFIILPPGTPHWFSSIDGSVTYVETRFPMKK